MQDLGLLPGYATSSGLLVNAASEVAGQVSSPTSPYTRGFFWANGVMQDLGTLGGQNTLVSDVDAQGRVIGTTTASTCLCSTRAFMWGDGMLRDLGALPGYLLAEAKGLNSRGDVVGRSIWSVGSDLWRATLWRHVAGAPTPRMVASE